MLYTPFPRSCDKRYQLEAWGDNCMCMKLKTPKPRTFFTTVSMDRVFKQVSLLYETTG